MLPVSLPPTEARGPVLCSSTDVHAASEGLASWSHDQNHAPLLSDHGIFKNEKFSAFHQVLKREV